MEPRPSALGVWIPSHWITEEVPVHLFKMAGCQATMYYITYLFPSTLYLPDISIDDMFLGAIDFVFVFHLSFHWDIGIEGL